MTTAPGSTPASEPRSEPSARSTRVGSWCRTTLRWSAFDDLEEVRYVVPSISSVAPDRSWLAEQAVLLLVERLSGKTSPPRRACATVTLHVRESSRA